jgi:hypothetical protein
MCTSIYLTDKKRFITTVRALADEMKIEPVNLVWADGLSYAEDPHGHDFKYCLCPIDVEESLKHCGYTGEWGLDNVDPMRFVASPVPNGERNSG